MHGLGTLCNGAVQRIARYDTCEKDVRILSSVYSRYVHVIVLYSECKDADISDMHR